MERDEALELIGDGHAVYSAETGQQVFEALGLEWKGEYAHPTYSDPVGTWKGLTLHSPDNEGEMMISALDLGWRACQLLQLKPESKLGRGFQGREYQGTIQRYFWHKEARSGTA